MLKKVGFVLVALVLSVSVFAGNNKLRSSSMTLASGTINPRESFNIATNGLMKDVNYNVVCKINDPNNKKNSAYIKVDLGDTCFWSNISAVLNGSFLGSQGKLTQVDNVLEIMNVKNDSTLSITNLDQDDSISVGSCVATPADETFSW
jgi:hypothetical protein